jgi:site-specific DNA recombinase
VSPRVDPKKKRKTAMPRRLSAVVRVSRRNGREGDSFMSPDQQKELIRAWAKANNVVIVNWHDETDSVSGKTTDRPGLQAAIKEALSGFSDGIIVARVDRFSRSLVEGLVAVHELDDAGRVFVAVGDGINSWGGRSQKLMLTLLLTFAEWHLESLTQAWVDARVRHIGAGVANVWPYGYERDTVTRRLHPHPAEAQWVTEVFKRRATGEAYWSIARALDAAGVKPRKGKTWTHAALHRMLQNRVYLGELTSGSDDEGVPIINRNAHEPLVTAAQWAAAHRVRKTPWHGNTRSFLLAGIARCAACGGRMGGVTYCRGTKTYRYYRCRRRFSWGTCPRPATIDATALEVAVLAAFDADYLQGAAFGAEVSTAALDASRDELAEAEADLSMFVTDESSIELRRVSPAAYARGQAMRTARVENARTSLTTTERHELGASLPRELPNVWGELDTEERRSVLAMVYPVIAVRATDEPKTPLDSDVGGRVKLYRAHLDDVPDVPGLGGCQQLVTIDW